MRLKKEHVVLGLEILSRLPLVGDAAQLIALSRLVDRFAEINYSKKRTVTAAVVEQHLKSTEYLAPVETDPFRRESPVMPAAKTPVAFAASEG